jgi:class 3 adenylate cyclase/tetratricopeptide (TPR) repeat protein
MKCPRCHTENPEVNRFCCQCGAELKDRCSACGSAIRAEDKFCGQCGLQIERVWETGKTGLETRSERKHVTVLFADLSGYTAMTEKLDPEEVNEIMSRIFGEIAQAVTRYGGFIERLIGDAAMVLFGVPKAHEDDPARAIRTALEINERIKALSPHFEVGIGQPLAMHSGINTGLVVTGEVDLEKGTHGITGDTINVASRLEGLAASGEILVGPATYAQTKAFFNFEHLEPAALKGKAEPLRIFKVLSPRQVSRKIRLSCGLSTGLIGRKAEQARLENIFSQLKDGQGNILSVCGNAGAGKSRLVEEFKAGLNLEEIRWLEGHASAYTQNTPYSLFIDLLTRTFQIQEGDSAARVRDKVKDGIEGLVGRQLGVVPYVAELFSLSYSDEDEASPENWKEQLFKAVKEIFTALAARRPTIVCLEDLHWADPSSLELIRFLFSDFSYSLIFLCIFRPRLTLLSDQQISILADSYQEIRLQDLLPDEAQDMIKALLKTEKIPAELKRFIREKVEGNPFYLEEVINSLIEAHILLRAEDGWILQGSISSSNIPPTIQGVISGRIDRLENPMKRILQEAAVIGREFYYAILSRISVFRENIESALERLEHLDLIKTKSIEPDLEFLFKHALTQEVAYGGLLIRERKDIHERIGHVIEQLFHGRLPEFYETLAFHYKQSQSFHKAVVYLVKSGDKSLRRYALEESHQNFRDAFEILGKKPDRSTEDNRLLIDLLNKWSFVYYYRGRYKDLLEILDEHKELAESLSDKETLGMFYAWYGCALWHRERFRDAHRYMLSALELAEETKNSQIKGYACSWLTWISTELGSMDQAISYAENAQQIYRSGQADQYVYFNSLAGMGYALWHRGEKDKTFEIGETLLKFGQRHNDNRSRVMGFCCMGWSHLVAGEISEATTCFQKAVKVSTDPWYSVFPKLALCYGFISDGRLQDAEQLIEEILEFNRERGAEFTGTPAHFFKGVVLIANGYVNRGMKILEKRLYVWQQEGCKLRYTACGYILAKVFAQIAQSKKKLMTPLVFKNLGFFIKNAPFVNRKAAAYFINYIAAAKEIEANGILGQAYLNWGLLYQAKSKPDAARKCFYEAIQYFEKCNAGVYLKQAREALNAV